MFSIALLTAALFSTGCGAASTPVGGTAAANEGLRPYGPDGASPASSLPAPTSASPLAPDPTSAPARHATLRFDVNGTSFPSPLVDAIVGGQPTTLIVDTGATQHVIASWLAAELALPLKSSGDLGVDHAGQTINVMRLEDAPLSISGWGHIPAPHLLVVDVPDILKRLNIGGFISPQALVERGSMVVLDLRAGEMREAPLEEALRRGEAITGTGGRREVRVCRGAIAGVRLIAAADIEGIAVQMQLDSGASQSSLFSSSPASKSLLGRAKAARRAYAASGAYKVPILEGAKVRFGGFDGTGDVDFLATASRDDCPSDGFLGMDVLRSCLLVIGEEGTGAYCKAK